MKSKNIGERVVDKLNLSVKRGEFEQVRKDLKKVKYSLMWLWVGCLSLAIGVGVTFAMVLNLIG